MKRAVVNIAFYSLLGLLGSSAMSQPGRSSATPSPTPLAEVESTTLLESYQLQVKKILDDSGRHFREGLAVLKTSQRSDSGSKFDNSVEIFLHSTLNIQKDQKLQTCYSQLIETIYRIEFPSDGQLPQIRGLSAACGWRWNDEDFKLADAVVAMLKPRSKTDGPTNPSGIPVGSSETFSEKTVGFNSQEFEPSPLDELSKLELTLDEEDLSRPHALPLRPNTRSSRLVTVPAQAGDTVARIAPPIQFDPVEVAKLNGLLPNSTLSEGRLIRLPTASESNAAGQRESTGRTECAIEAMPLVQGVRLGMSPAQVSAASNRRFTINKRRTFYSGQTTLIGSKSTGIRLILLTFYSSRLYEITVYYDDSIRWSGVREFERAVAKALNIPNSWIDGSTCTVGRNCRLFLCSEKKFHLTLGETGGFYSLNIWDPITFSQMLKDNNNRRLADLKKKELEQQRRKNEFKP